MLMNKACKIGMKSRWAPGLYVKYISKIGGGCQQAPVQQDKLSFSTKKQPVRQLTLRLVFPFLANVRRQRHGKLYECLNQLNPKTYVTPIGVNEAKGIGERLFTTDNSDVRLPSTKESSVMRKKLGALEIKGPSPDPLLIGPGNHHVKWSQIASVLLVEQHIKYLQTNCAIVALYGTQVNTTVQAEHPKESIATLRAQTCYDKSQWHLELGGLIIDVQRAIIYKAFIYYSFFTPGESITLYQAKRASNEKTLSSSWKLVIERISQREIVGGNYQILPPKGCELITRYDPSTFNLLVRVEVLLVVVEVSGDTPDCTQPLLYLTTISTGTNGEFPDTNLIYDYLVSIFMHS
ncbi:hypothetical protein CBL_03792 [Carabus blaptoides fortunei]